jgi:uncharacterized membrane protein
MNLDLYPIGWVHTLTSIIAVIAGGVVLVPPKGTATHRLRGRIYVLALVLTGVTSFAIYRQGKFWFPHWIGVASLVIVGMGFAFAHFKLPRRGWMHLHLTCMIASYYMLIGGGINEVFLRVDVLRRLAPDVLNSSMVGMTHFAVMLLFAILIAYYNAALVLRARPA